VPASKRIGIACCFCPDDGASAGAGDGDGDDGNDGNDGDGNDGDGDDGDNDNDALWSRVRSVDVIGSIQLAALHSCLRLAILSFIFGNNH